MRNSRCDNVYPAGRRRPPAGRVSWPAGVLAVVVVAASPQAAPAYADGPCSSTSLSVKRACLNEARDEFWIAKANCINVTDQDGRVECRDDAQADLDDARDECREQYEARLDLCDALGEDRYDPAFDPSEFVSNFDNQNEYYPLEPGNMWSYESPDETNTVEVLNKTKRIEGVDCIVVHDAVFVNGVPLELTDDWYAQASNGDVWYAGESSGEYETFAGDNPMDAELVDIEGSWKTGRDGAKPGVVMHADPVPGTTYRQELLLGDAEDAAEVLSDSYGYGNDPGLDDLVPAALATLLCSNDDCVVTREFTPLEPDVDERKYYAPGIGIFLEVDLTSGDVNQLVGCNVSPLCASLPAP